MFKKKEMNTCHNFWNDKNIHIPNPYIKVIGSLYYRPLELICGSILGGWNIRRQLRAQVHK